MSVNDELLASTIVSELNKAGFKPTGDNTVSNPFWLAIATAINKHYTSNAEVNVTSGSSKGTYKVT